MNTLSITKKAAITLSLGLVVCCFSCKEIQDLLPQSLSEAEITEGLKEALSVGTDTTVSELIQTDAYYNDAVLKILLPDDVQSFLSTLKNAIGESLYNSTIKVAEDNLVKSLNSSASDAAKKAAPIFKNAITSMTISDAAGILSGSDTAATHYLREKTFDQLTAAYAPKIDSSLDKPLLLGISTNDYWDSFRSAYNGAVSTYNSTIGLFGDPLATLPDQSLGTYTTAKALNGLFLKIKDEEAAIRKDPAKQVTDILKKVFGS